MSVYSITVLRENVHVFTLVLILLIRTISLPWLEREREVPGQMKLTLVFFSLVVFLSAYTWHFSKALEMHFN